MGPFLGIDIGGTNIKAALVSDSGSVLGFAQRAWSGGPPDEALSVARDLSGGVARLAHDSAPSAAGAGCAGLVECETGVVRASPNLPEWRDVQLGRMLEDALGVPVVVDNDANVAAYGEYLAGAARGSTNAVMLTLGTGVGGGLILDGRPYRGGGFAGEVGHMTVAWDGPECSCGGLGCWEREVNAQALIRRAAAGLESGRESTLAAIAAERPLAARDVGEAAASGDALALRAVEETGRMLGVGLANLTLLLDPDVFVVGGGVAEVGAPLLTAAREEMARRAYGCRFRAPRVVAAELGERAGVIGAALMARDETSAS